MADADPRHPDPPSTQRLNARAGVLLGVMLAVTVAAILFAITAKAPRVHAAPAADPVPSQPTFLGRPPAADEEAQARSREDLERVLAEARRAKEAAQVPPPNDDAVLYGAPSAQTAPQPPADPRHEAYLRALRAPMAPGSSSRTPRRRRSRSRRSRRRPAPPHPAWPRWPRASTPRRHVPARRAQRPPFQGFLRSVDRVGSPELPVRWEPRAAEPTLQAGTVLPAVLLTAIDSDLPGDLVAQVTRDVYDSATLHTVLVPAGSRLLGRYDHQVELGQSRLLVAWTRLLLPDGRSLSFPGLPATTTDGEAGLVGSTDNHLRRVFGSALLLSLISAGVQLSQPQESATFGQAASARQVAGAALGQELGSVALEILRRGVARRPTLRIPAGSELYVFVNGDIAFPTTTR